MAVAVAEPVSPPQHVVPPLTELEKLHYDWKLAGVPREVILGAQRRQYPYSYDESDGCRVNPMLVATAQLRIRVERCRRRRHALLGGAVLAAALFSLAAAGVCDLADAPGCARLRSAMLGLHRGWASLHGLAICLGLGVVLMGLNHVLNLYAPLRSLFFMLAYGSGGGAISSKGGCPLGFGTSSGTRGGKEDPRVEADVFDTHKRKPPKVAQAADWQKKRDSVWEFLNEVTQASTTVKWPATTDVGAEVFNGDYTSLLTRTEDMKEGTKLLCPAGAVAQVKIEWFRGHGYSGLFAEGDLEGIMRLSSAMAPVSGLPSFSGQISRAKVFPCAAVKVFRDNVPSGNLLFGGSKTGQAETNYFSHCQCTHMTEKVGLLLRPILERFRQYSNFPTQLGLSDFARFARDGTETEEPSFPWCLVLRPSSEVMHVAQEVDSRFNGMPEARDGSTGFIEQILALGENTVLYDIFAVPSPAAALVGGSQQQRGGGGGGDAARNRRQTDAAQFSLIRVGRVSNTTRFVRSVRDQQLFFKHQRKEEDYDLKPEWFGQVRPEHQLYGSKEFERRINQGLFQDLESFSNAAGAGEEL